jgi:hypothetical protein
MLCLFHKYNAKTLTKSDFRNHVTKHMNGKVKSRYEKRNKELALSI